MSQSASKALSARARLELGVALAALMTVAWLNRFVQDDSFISFRYADHLARGWGLVWNRGERIEGFTNFLYTVVLGGLMRLGAEPVATSYVLGLSAFVLTLLTTYALTAQLLVARGLEVRRWPLLCVCLLGLNFSFSCYATGGLETSWQSLAFTAMLYARGWVRAGRAVHGALPAGDRLLLVSLLFAFAIGTRLDSVLVVALVGGSMSLDILRAEASAREKGRALACLGGPGGVLVAALVVFKLAYFGSLVPNTFYAKASSFAYAKAQGLPYVWWFLRHYWLWPHALLALVYLPSSVRSKTRELRVLLGVVAIWLLYVVWVGGDFMEFRLIVPVLPASFAYLVTILAGLRLRWALPLALATILASAWYARVQRRAIALGDPHYVLSIHGLAGFIDDPAYDWPQLGRALGELTAHDPDVVLGVAAAGAIPYYSGLTTVDMHGLSDAWVAKHGIRNGNRPGHQRMASLAYLLERKVNLVIRMRSPQEQLESYQYSDLAPYVRLEGAQMPADACVVEIPISPTRTLRALYLTRTPQLDARFRENNVRFFPTSTTP